jgi:N12 class adenine-specific DNA methylase/flagellum-specific peptidoglycan hydrolase FlgJ/2'-5' RNA ligase
VPSSYLVPDDQLSADRSKAFNDYADGLGDPLATPAAAAPSNVPTSSDSLTNPTLVAPPPLPPPPDPLAGLPTPDQYQPGVTTPTPTPAPAAGSLLADLPTPEQYTPGASSTLASGGFVAPTGSDSLTNPMRAARSDDSDPMARARAFLGDAYVWGGKGPQQGGGFDCSGLAGYLADTGTPESTTSLYAKSAAIDPRDVRPGDLVFYNMGQSDMRLQHVGTAIGGGQLVQAGGTSNSVNIASVDQPVGSPPEYRRLNAGVANPADGRPAQASGPMRNAPTGSDSLTNPRRSVAADPTQVVPDSSSREAFIRSTTPLAQVWADKTGIPASYFLAINGSESNWGKAAGNELFGIKAAGNAGSTTQGTWEQEGGQRVDQNAGFGAYKTANDAYAAFVDLVTNTPRYAAAWAGFQKDHDPDALIAGLNKAGYATDPNWASNVSSIARTVAQGLPGGDAGATGGGGGSAAGEAARSRAFSDTANDVINAGKNAVGDAASAAAKAPQSFMDWATSLGNPLDHLPAAPGIPQTPAPRQPDQLPMQGGDLTAGPIPNVSAGSPQAVGQPNPDPLDSALELDPESPLGRSIIKGQPLSGPEQLQAGVQTVRGYEAAHQAQIEDLNPAKDVPVLGGLSTGVASMGTDPLTYVAQPGVKAAVGSVEAGVARLVGPEIAARVPAAFKWAADQGLTGGAWGALQASAMPDATPESVAKGVGIGAAFGLGAGVVTGAATGTLGHIAGAAADDAVASGSSAAVPRAFTPAEQIEATALRREIAKAVHPDLAPDGAGDPTLMSQANVAYDNGDLDTLKGMAKELNLTVGPKQAASADANQSWFGSVKQAANDFATGTVSNLGDLVDVGKSAVAWVFRHPEAPVEARARVLVLGQDLSKAAEAGDSKASSAAIRDLSTFGESVAGDPTDQFLPGSSIAHANEPSGYDSARTTNMSSGAPIADTGLHFYGQQQHSPQLLQEVANSPAVADAATAFQQAHDALLERAQQANLVHGSTRFAGLSFGQNYQGLFTSRATGDQPSAQPQVTLNLHELTDQAIQEATRAFGANPPPEIVAATLAAHASDTLAHEIAHLSTTEHDAAHIALWNQIRPLAMNGPINAQLTGEMLGIVRGSTLSDWTADYQRLKEGAGNDARGSDTSTGSVAHAIQPSEPSGPAAGNTGRLTGQPDVSGRPGPVLGGRAPGLSGSEGSGTASGSVVRDQRDQQAPERSDSGAAASGRATDLAAANPYRTGGAQGGPLKLAPTPDRQQSWANLWDSGQRAGVKGLTQGGPARGPAWHEGFSAGQAMANSPPAPTAGGAGEPETEAPPAVTTAGARPQSAPDSTTVAASTPAGALASPAEATTPAQLKTEGGSSESTTVAPPADAQMARQSGETLRRMASPAGEKSYGTAKATAAQAEIDRRAANKGKAPAAAAAPNAAPDNALSGMSTEDLGRIAWSSAQPPAASARARAELERRAAAAPTAAPASAPVSAGGIHSLARGGELKPGDTLYSGKAGKDAPAEPSKGATRYGPGQYLADSRRVAEIFAEHRPGGTVDTQPMPEGLKLLDTAQVDTSTPEFKKLRDLLVDRGVNSPVVNRLARESADFFEAVRKMLPDDGGMWRGADALNTLAREAGYHGIVGYTRDSTDLPNHTEIVLFKHEEISHVGTTLPAEAAHDDTSALQPDSGQRAVSADHERAGADGSRVARAEQQARAASLREGPGVHRPQSTSNPAAGVEPDGQRVRAPRGVGPGDSGGSPGPLVEPGRDYRLSAEDEAWQEHTPATKRLEANVDAIRRAVEIQASGRDVTPEDRQAFARFSGMGASEFNDAFPSAAKSPNTRMVALGKQIRELLGDAEYQSISRSRLNAHFTTPTVVRAMWNTIGRFGAGNLPNASILEPSAGSGRFLAMMPEGLHDRATVNAVEMDMVTGQMLRGLFPEASVHIMPFQRVDVEAPGAVPDNSQDIVISNVPFGQIRVADPAYGKHPELTQAVHNYFFAKGLDKARPGGVVAFITSHYTFDAASGGRTDFRRYLAERADLLGAVRLPSGAFPDTRVTTDILFFRKREGPPSEAADPEWLNSDPRSFEFKGNPIEVHVNRYFLDHPEMALGEHGVSGQTTDGVPGYVLHQDKSTPIEDQLNTALATLPRDVLQPRDDVAGPSEATQAASRAVEGSFVERDGRLMSQAEGKLRPAGRFITRAGKTIGGKAATESVWRKLTAEQTTLAKVAFKTDGVWPDWALTQRGVKERTWTPYSPGEVAKIQAAIKIHDLGREVLDLQRQGVPDARMRLAQAQLKRAYDAFVRANGPLHTQTNRSLMRSDPRSYWLQSLEHWSDDLEKAFAKRITPATLAELGQLRGDIFSKTVQAPAGDVKTAETPKDALLVSLNDRGTLDLKHMAKLLGRPPNEIAADLHSQGLIYKNPALKGQWETADEYLSGKVKLKLEQAKAAGKAYAANVAALEKVQPALVPAGQIDVRLGSAWVPETDVNEFVQRTLFKPQYQGGDGSTGAFRLTRTTDMVKWGRTSTSNNDYYRLDPAKAAEFGTERMDPLDIVSHALNATSIRVMDSVGDGKTVFNEAATRAANGKLKAIKAEFLKWLWADPERADRLSTLYNDTFNDSTDREWDGSHLRLPGSNPAIIMRPHQKDATWRAIQSPSILLAHEVGYGKSMTMAAIAMELRRLGLARRPAIVVPNHLVGQMAKEFYKLYPQANLLVPSKADFEADGRAALMARIASGDWDSVIMPQSQFKLLPVHPATALRFIDELRADLARGIEGFTGDRKERSFKDLQKRLENATTDVLRAQDRLRDFQSNRKGELTYDDLGIDSLMVDEADAYKNLQFFTTRTRVKGLPNSKSDRAFDMHMKSKLLLETRGRGLVFATGTPISNTIAELWTMLRYLQPETMKELGLSSFDAWASAFGDTVENMEQTITGEFKSVQRFARFGNAPELSKLFQRVADIRMAEDSPEMEAKKPPMVGNRRIPVKALSTPWHKQYLEGLVARAKALKGMPVKGGDNMLSITSDARKASLDPSLVGGAEHPAGKLKMVVDNVVDVYHREAADKGTQLVFLDLGTPKSTDGVDKSKLPAELKEQLKQASSAPDWDASDEDTWIQAYYADHDLGDPTEQRQISDVYNRIKSDLVARGIPAEHIAFIHDANNDKQRAALYGQVNAGAIRVLIGSTEKMGAGTNVQQRIAALHHLDTPWRPRDLEQREGRALRPGNKVYGPPVDEFGNPLKDAKGQYLKGRGVEVYQYTTEWPFDAYLWSTLLSKMRAIKAFMRRHVSERNLVDADEHILDLEELEALASGDPMALKRHGVVEELRQLEAEARDHLNRQSSARSELKALPEQLASSRAAIVRGEADQVLRDKAGDRFSIKVDGKTFDKRTDAGQPLVDAIKRMAPAELGRYEQSTWSPLATLKGFGIEVGYASGTWGVRATNPAHGADGNPYSSGPIDWADLNPAGVVARIENLLRQIDTRLDYTRGKVRDAVQRQAAMQEFAGTPYADAPRLEQLSEALRMIEARMAGGKKPAPNETEPIYSDQDIAAVLDGAPPVRPADAPVADDPQAVALEESQSGTAAVEETPRTPEEAPAAALAQADDVQPSADLNTAEGALPATGTEDSPAVPEDTTPSVPTNEDDPELAATSKPPPEANYDGARNLPAAQTEAPAPQNEPQQPETSPLVQGPENVPPTAIKDLTEADIDRMLADQDLIDRMLSGEDVSAPEAAAPVPADASSEAPTHEYQSTQANLPAELADKVKRYQRGLDPADVVSLEDQPHITLKFGLHPGVDISDVERILHSQGPIRVTFGNNGVFPAGPDGVPLYVSVDSTDLHRLNGMLSAVLPNTETHPDYKPHVTIAYLTPEAAAKYDGEHSPLAGTSATIDSVAFSDTHEQQTEIALTGRTNGITPHTNGTVPPAAVGGGAQPPIEPPAPPAPPAGPPEEPEDPLQHVVGFGYQRGTSAETQAALTSAAADHKQSRIGRDEIARAAAILHLDEAGMARLQASILGQADGSLAAESQALRDQAVGAVQAALDFGRLQRSAAAKLAADPNAVLSDEERVSLDDATVAAVRAATELDVKASRRLTNEIARALQQHKLEVTAFRARTQYQRLEALAPTNLAAIEAIERALTGKDLADLDVEHLLIAAEQLETAAPLITETGGAATAILEKLDETNPAPAIEENLHVSPDVAAAIAARPLLHDRALDLVKLTPEWKAARAAGDWDAAHAIKARRGALIDSIRQDLADEANLPTRARRPAKPLTEEQRNVEDRTAKGVLAKMRRELLVSRRDPDPQRTAELEGINAAVRQLVLEQEISGKDILPRAARLAEIDRQQADARGAGNWDLVDKLERERDTTLHAIEDEITRQVSLPTGPRPPNAQAAVQSMLGKPKVAAIRARIAEAIKYPTKRLDDRIARLERNGARKVDRAEVSALVKELRDLANNGFHRPGAASQDLKRLREIQQQLRGISNLAADRASGVKQSLYRQGLKRYLGSKDVPEDRLNDLIGMLMTADPNQPEQLGVMLRALRQPTVWDKLREHAIVALLSSPMTWGLTGVNVLSNTMMMSGRLAVAMPLDAIHDAGRYASRGKERHIYFGEVGAGLIGARDAWRKSSQLAAQIMVGGRAHDTNAAALETGDMGALRREFLSEGRFGWLGQWMHRISTRPLEAADAFQGNVMYGMMVGSLAQRKAEQLVRANDPYATWAPSGAAFDPDGSGGLEQGPGTKMTVDQVRQKILRNPWDHPELIDEAGKVERYTMLRDKPPRWFTAFARLRTPDPSAPWPQQAGGYLMHSVLPFLYTPFNWSKIGVEHSAPGALYQAARYVTEKDPIEQARRWRILVAGAMIAAVGAALLAGDNLTGDGPNDPSKRRIWNDTHQRNSIRWGGEWLSYDGTFFAIPLSTVANFGESFAESSAKAGGKLDGNVFASGFLGGLKGIAFGISSQSFLKSLGDLQEIVAGRRDPSSLLANFVDRHIPLDALIAFLARTGDGLERRQTSFSDQVLSRTPFRGNLRPQLSALGHEVNNEQMGLQALIPFKPNPKPEQQNPVEREFERLGVNLPPPPSTVLTVPLNEDERYAYEKAEGALIEQSVSHLMQSASWPSRTDQMRAKLLGQIVASVRSDMEGPTLKAMGKDEIRRRMLAARDLKLASSL